MKIELTLEEIEIVMNALSDYYLLGEREDYKEALGVNEKIFNQMNENLKEED